MLGPLNGMLGPLGRAAILREAIYTNAAPASITPTEGAELITNGGFTDWTGGNPNNWTVTGEVGTDPEVSEVGAGEGHGGIGTGFCNLYSSATAAKPEIEQSVLTINTFVKVSYLLNFRSTGTSRMTIGGTNMGTVTTPATYTYVLRTAGLTVKLSPGTTCNYTIDDVSAKTLSDTLAQQQTHVTALSYNQCAMTIAVARQSGVYHRHSASGDYVLAYADRRASRIYLIKSVSGTVSEITSVVFTYSAGNVLKLKHHEADGWQVFYDTAANIDTASAIITSTALTDANLDACNEDGLFSTDSGTTFADYKWSPN